jgi:hypothetical protein
VKGTGDRGHLDCGAAERRPPGHPHCGSLDYKMRFRSLVAAVVIVLLATGAISYRNYVCAGDRRHIETIILTDQKFREINIKRLGGGLLLEGSVANSEDLNRFFQQVNAVKRGRVVSKIVVQRSGRTADLLSPKMRRQTTILNR